MQRSPIYNALLAQVQGITSAPYSLAVPVIELGLVHWEEQTVQPAVFVDPETETPSTVRGQPTKQVLQVSIWIYTRNEGKQKGLLALIPIMDAIDKILKQAPGAIPYANTLGGLVSSCALNGQTQISGGYLGTQSVARMGVEIVLPD